MPPEFELHAQSSRNVSFNMTDVDTYERWKDKERWNKKKI